MSNLVFDYNPWCSSVFVVVELDALKANRRQRIFCSIGHSWDRMKQWLFFPPTKAFISPVVVFRFLAWPPGKRVTAKRILERLEYRLHHHLSKFDRSVFLILKPIFYFLVFIWLGFFLSRNYWSLVRLASIWEKAISICAGNLNSGRGYLITAVSTPKLHRWIP